MLYIGKMTPPFQISHRSALAKVLVVCDHASALIPGHLGTLGLTPEQLASHIAWDIGAAQLSTLLARQLNAQCILAGVSRLVVDCNRAPGAAGWMPAETCGVAVPGNRDLSSGDIQDRVRHWYDPYHRAIAENIVSMGRPVVLAIHSFTPVMNGQPRPWHVGILWNRDQRLARPVIDGLRQIGGVTVGDNQPYSGQTLNYTLDHHADSAGLPHLSIELRQDLIADDAGVQQWGRILLKVLVPILTQMGL